MYKTSIYNNNASEKTLTIILSQHAYKKHTAGWCVLSWLYRQCKKQQHFFTSSYLYHTSVNIAHSIWGKNIQTLIQMCPIMNLARCTRPLPGSLGAWKGYTVDHCCILHHLQYHTAGTNLPQLHQATCWETINIFNVKPLWRRANNM